MDADAETTVAEAIAMLRGDGFSADMSVSAEGRIWCGRCGRSHAPQVARVAATYRFEGMSDPDDEAVVFGLVCGQCRARGVLVAAYGAAASAEEAAVAAGLGTQAATSR
jgi:hypothetical protein